MMSCSFYNCGWYSYYDHPYYYHGTGSLSKLSDENVLMSVISMWHRMKYNTPDVRFMTGNEQQEQTRERMNIDYAITMEWFKFL